MAGRAYNVGLDSANLSKEQLALKVKEYVPNFYVHFAAIGEDPDKRNYVVSSRRLREAGFVGPALARRGHSGTAQGLRHAGPVVVPQRRVRDSVMIETVPRLPTVLPRDVTVAILAGGLGTRLRPAVADLPKPLAPVLGRPFLTHLLDSLAASGAERAPAACRTQSRADPPVLGNRYAGISLDYCAEPEPLGTGGAVRHALGRVSSPSVLLAQRRLVL